MVQLKRIWSRIQTNSMLRLVQFSRKYLTSINNLIKYIDHLFIVSWLSLIMSKKWSLCISAKFHTWRKLDVWKRTMYKLLILSKSTNYRLKLWKLSITLMLLLFLPFKWKICRNKNKGHQLVLYRMRVMQILVSLADIWRIYPKNKVILIHNNKMIMNKYIWEIKIYISWQISKKRISTISLSK